MRLTPQAVARTAQRPGLILATAEEWGIFCGALPVLGRWGLVRLRKGRGQIRFLSSCITKISSIQVCLASWSCFQVFICLFTTALRLKSLFTCIAHKRRMAPINEFNACDHIFICSITSSHGVICQRILGCIAPQYRMDIFKGDILGQYLLDIAWHCLYYAGSDISNCSFV